jgi:hypothetical protein
MTEPLAVKPPPTLGTFVKRYRWLLAALATAAVILGIVAAVGGFSAGTFTMTGSLIIIDETSLFPDLQTDKTDCQGTGGFSDLSPGTAVVIQDSTGQTLATGALSAGRRDPGSGACLMPFTVPDVKDGLGSYSVTISHRGTQVFTSANAHSGVVLTITAGP